MFYVVRSWFNPSLRKPMLNKKRFFRDRNNKQHFILEHFVNYNFLDISAGFNLVVERVCLVTVILKMVLWL